MSFEVAIVCPEWDKDRSGMAIEQFNMFVVGPEIETTACLAQKLQLWPFISYSTNKTPFIECIIPLK